MKKKKMLLIALPIILILVTGIVLTVLYFITDIFKANDTLFAKYFLQNEEIWDIIKNSNIDEQYDFKQKNTYTMTGELTAKVQDEENLQELKAVTAARHDTNTGRTYSEILLKDGETDILKVSYINSEDVYAIKCNDIMTNYIGIRNSELKQFAQNMGITEANIKNIPDSINFNELSDISNITSEQKKHIIDTYSKVIFDSISKNNYTKLGKTDITIDNINYKTNAYQVEIDTANLKQIIINCLTNLKNDNITLAIMGNKLASLGVNREYTDITKLSEKIESLTTQIQKAKIDDGKITIIVYENKGKTVKTELTISTNQKEQIESITNTTPIQNEVVATTNTMTLNKMTIDKMETESGKKAILTIEQEDAEGSMVGTTPSSTMSQIILEKNTTNENTTNEITIIPDTTNTAQSIVISANMGKVKNNTISNLCNVKLNISYDGINSQTIESSYIQNIQSANEVEEIQELKNSNTIIVNNYTKSQLIPFLTKVTEKSVQVIPNKLAQLGINIILNPNNNVDNSNLVNSNNNIKKIAEIIGTSGVSIANANGLDLFKVITIGGIEMGMASYNHITELINRAQDATLQMNNAGIEENQIVQNIEEKIDTIIGQ